MRKNKLIFGLLLIVMGAAFVFAEDIPDYVTNAPGAVEYPGEDGLIVRQIVEITLDADGKVTRREETALKMLTGYVDRQKHFDPHISWNDTRSELHVDIARSYMRDGTIIDAKKNSVVANTPAELQWAVPYAHIREMIVAHVGVEHDGVTVLGYTITDREPSGVPLWGDIELQAFIPVLDQRITIRVPEGTTLYYSCVGCEMEPEVESSGGTVSYSFHRTNVPSANLAEIPGTHHGLDRLVYSTVDEWADVSTFVGKLVEAAVVVDETVRLKMEEIVGNATLPIEKISLIHGFIVDGVRPVHWPVAAFDYAVRSAADVLSSSIGHPLDKAVLFTAILREAGFQAHVALSPSDPLIAGNVASPTQFDRVWVRVQIGEKWIWLDPDTGLDRRNGHDISGYPTLIISGRAIGRLVMDVNPASAFSNRVGLRAEIEIEDGGHELLLSGFADVDLAMSYNPLVAYDRTKNRQARLAGLIAEAFGGASSDEIFIARQTCDLTSLRTEFSGGSIDVPLDGLVRVSLPRVPNVLSGEKMQTDRVERTLPLLVPHGPCFERTELVFTLPKGYEPVFLPEDMKIDNYSGSVQRIVKLEERVLTIITELEVKVTEVVPAKWPGFRSLVNALEGEKASTILLQRTE